MFAIFSQYLESAVFFLSLFVFIQSRPIFLVYFVNVASLIFLNLVLLHQQIINSSLSLMRNEEKDLTEKGAVG